MKKMYCIPVCILFFGVISSPFLNWTTITSLAIAWMCLSVVVSWLISACSERMPFCKRRKGRGSLMTFLFWWWYLAFQDYN